MEGLKFKRCSGYLGYEAALDGTIRYVSRGKATVLKTIHPFNDDTNYVRVKLFSKFKQVKVSYMIALAFLPKKKGDILKCINGNWNDYDISNYKWENPRELSQNTNKEWRSVRGFGNKYEVSEDGEIRNYRTCTILKPYIHRGHLYVRLYDEKRTNRPIALLVAEAFTDIPEKVLKKEKRAVVGHKDGNVLNNHYTNLIWGKKDISHSSPPPKKAIKVHEYTPDGKFVQEWSSLSKASFAYNIGIQDICNCCKGRAYSAAGRVWRWSDESFNSHKTPDIPQLLPDEYFKPIKGTYAEVSNYGRVRNMRRCGRLYKVRSDDTVQITTAGKTIAKKVYTMVAEAFLTNPNGYKRVGFKDGNRKNWHIDNLVWLRDME